MMMQKIVHWVIPILVIISLFTITPQYVQSANGNTHIILFSKDYTREFTAGQTVHLEGQIIQNQSPNPSGVANAHFQIIDAGTGTVIMEGNTDNQGLLFVDWIASQSVPGKSEVNLIVRFAGGGGYDPSDSPPLTLTISSPSSPSTPSTSSENITPSFVYHNTQLSIQVRSGSSPGYVQINPTSKIDSGSLLTTTQVSISVDGNNITTISSNQWSGDIFVGSGTHNISASIPQLTDSRDEHVIYRESSGSITYTPPNVNTYFDTQLSIQVRDGSSLGYIQVTPLLTYSGNPLSTIVTLSIDGNNITTISSNQWSGDIFVGSGTHKIQVYFPQTQDPTNKFVIFKSSSYMTYYTISTNPTSINTPSTNNPSLNSPSSSAPNQEFPILWIVIIAIILVITAVGITKMRRRTKMTNQPVMGNPFGVTPGSPNSSQSDDTQFYGCPNCGGDIIMKYNKQFCNNCRMYL